MKKKILIVDDHEDALSVMRLQLSRLGDFQVLEASGGLEGLEQFCGHAPDIVFIDITMPGMSGYELMARIRKETNGGSAPIIAWTSLPEDELGNLIAAGFNDYLCKFSGGGLSLRDILRKYRISG